MSELAVALVGAGYTSAEHAKAFAAVPGVRLAGIHSRTRARAEALAAKAGIAEVCVSVDELWEETRAGLVVVTVTELSMNAVAKACFKHPWTVLLEKPAGKDLADALDLARAARASGRCVLVALNRAMYSATLAAREGLAAEKSPRFVKVQDQQSMARALAAGQPKEVVDRWMFANSVHLVDYFRLLARGRAVSVEPVIAWNPSRPGPVVAKVLFESGDAGLYEAVWEAPGPWAATVTAGARRWELRPLEALTTQELGQPAKAVEAHAWDREFKPGFRLQAEEAVAAALGKPSRCVTLDESLATMRLVAALYGDASALTRPL